MWKKFVEILAALGGAALSFFTGMPPVLWVLVAIMSLDYVTGLICGAMGKSPKTENGYLESRAAFKGLMKKVLILLVVLLAMLLDRAVELGAGIEFEAVAGATCLWFIASEGISVLENAAAMEIPIPQILLRMLELFRSKGGDDKPPDHN